MNNEKFSEPIKIGEIPKHLRSANVYTGKFDSGFNSIEICKEKEDSNLVVRVQAGWSAIGTYHIASDGNGKYTPKLVTLK